MTWCENIGKWRQKVKILHVVRTMNVGGIENFVRNLIINQDKRYQCECLICDQNISDYEEEIRRKIKVYKLNAPVGIKLEFVWNLHTFFKKNHDYDIVHVHMAFSNGLVGFAAKRNGIRHVVYHSHGVGLNQKNSLMMKLYQRSMCRRMKYTGDSFIACSMAAGIYLFGADVFKTNGVVLKNGIDVRHYLFDKEVRDRVRRRYGISAKDFVIGHVGTVNENKNQLLIIKTAAKLIREGEPLKVFLVGDGVLADELKEEAKREGIREQVIFAGKKDDAAPYLSAMDVFMFPSISEGFGIAMLEAQASGLPCVVSDSIQPEVKIFMDYMINIHLADSIDVWCEGIRHALYMKRNPDTYEGLKSHGFDICCTIKILNDLYDRYKEDGEI